MSKPREYICKVEPRDLDYTGHPTIIAIGDYLLNAAGQDADIRGFGVRNLNQNNCSWVLSRMAVEIVRYPEQYEELTIRTWVSEVGRLMTTRNLVMLDRQGDIIVSSVTYWAMIDLSSRRPMDLSHNENYTNAVIDLEIAMDKPIKIGHVTPSQTSNHKVVYSDIDFNGHANSMKYLSWMIDMLPEDYHTQKHLMRFDLNFIHEARYGETLQICFEELAAESMISDSNHASNSTQNGNDSCGYPSDTKSLFEICNSEQLPICRASLAWYPAKKV